jgi:uncharacterized protein YgiM (DUF1202 family)
MGRFVPLEDYMQTLLKTPMLLLLSACLFCVSSVQGAEQTAVVNEGKINVRGQPSLVGEVVTQLQKGDQVTVLEYVRNERAKGGEPTNWAKIKLPANTPVWVYQEMVRNGAVSATRLNLRAGPGDNYSVLGRLNKGDKITSIRTMGDWMEIEAPSIAYAFIDASLISPAAGEPKQFAAAAPPTATPETETAVSTPTISTSAPPTEVTTPQPSVQDALAAPTQPAVSTPEPPAAIPSVTAPPSTTTVLPSSALPSITKAPEPATARPEEDRARRIVRREGIVRPTVSIQAPTWYELVHPQTKRTIDYLHAEKLGANLKEFKGKKVIVSGEEAVDPRWPNTPILELETLDVAP